jgi:hypothetical protein
VALGVGQRHEDHAAHPRLEVLGGDAVQRHLALEGVHHRLDRLHPVVGADPLREVGGVVLRVVGGPARGHRHPDDLVPADRVGGDGGHQRGVDPAGHAEHHAAEAVLAHVAGQAGDERPVHLLVGVQRGGERTARVRLPDRRQVPHQQVLDELRGARQQRRLGDRCAPDLVRPAGLADDHEGPAVEYQVVLAADHVHVRDGRAHLAGAPRGQVHPLLGLALLVGGAVDHQHQVDALADQRLDRPVLPDVLADHQAHPAAVHVDHAGLGAGGEDPELVEDAVVRQVPLVVALLHRAVPEHDALVGGTRRGAVVLAGGALADAADHHGQVAQAGGLQCGGEIGQRALGAAAEGRALREVLDRVAGDGHLRERDQAGARLGGPAHPGDDRLGVAGDVAHTGVDLGEGDPQVTWLRGCIGHGSKPTDGSTHDRRSVATPARNTDQAGCPSWTGSRSSCSARSRSATSVSSVSGSPTCSGP